MLRKKSNTQYTVSKPSCLFDPLPTISINWVGIIDDMRVKVKLTAQKQRKRETVNWSLAAKSRELDKQLNCGLFPG